ncbi:DUF4440 domain-containing protein [Flavobacteriaceae bacterium XHP0103]|uniref:DUF4440 domain-containing protein n=1 Tax=Marixanthotalea marina TaxID=2844359 RepID=UPI002989ED19|nr:DUF4440 domain-containing protein [Marixanthotalea marina]MBU3820946.1 DUF4440 domain-containing protein [Marixanthotalea marina]
MKKFLILFFVMPFCFISAQTNPEKDQKEINAVLKAQRIAWSKNNIDDYMEGYWKSDSLKLYSKNGIIQGWYNVSAHYKKFYPDKDYTGVLSYRINDISQIEEGAYYVLAEYHVKRDAGNLDGYFMLIFKRIGDEWKIIANTTT